jgi:hypothetical protein
MTSTLYQVHVSRDSLAVVPNLGPATHSSHHAVTVAPLHQSPGGLLVQACPAIGTQPHSGLTDQGHHSHTLTLFRLRINAEIEYRGHGDGCLALRRWSGTVLLHDICYLFLSQLNPLHILRTCLHKLLSQRMWVFIALLTLRTSFQQFPDLLIQ